jgi:hypothetical protein
VSIAVNALPNQGLVAGTFNGEIVLRAAGTPSSVTIPVSVAVGTSVFTQLPALNFAMPFGGSNPLPQVVNVTSTGSEFSVRAAEFTATGGDWLSISGCGSFCSTPRAITVTVNAPAGLAPGVYTGQIIFTEFNNSMAMTVPVTLTVTGGGGPQCTFSIAPPSGAFGENGGAASFRLTATGTNCNTSTAAWTARSSVSWVQVFPLSGTGTADIGYTVFPNFGTTLRSAAITAGGQNFTITQAAATGTQMQRFVRLLYYFYLGRPPSQSDIDFHVSSGLSQAQMAVNFFRSGEFLLGGRYVGGLYVGLLNRDPEYGGWAFQRNALVAGDLTFRLGIVTNFLNSAEYKLNFGVPTDAEFITLLYEKILLRLPSQAEVDWHVGHLVGGMPRAQKASDFLASQEFSISSGPRLTAALLYFTLLQRDPTPSERQNLIDRIIAREPDLSLIGGIVGSQEFQNILQ